MTAKSLRRRVARVLRGTRSRTYGHRLLAAAGVSRTGIRSPGTEDPRSYLVKQLHGRAKDVDSKRIPADPIRDHVFSTVTPARRGRAFRLIARGSSPVMAKFFFKNPSFDCIVA